MKTLNLFSKFVFFLLVSSIFCSCGTSYITCKRSDAQIYVDGVNKGKGTVQIKRMGVPHTAEITAKVNDVEIGRTYLKRKFDGVTFILGMFTYYTGFYWAWRYPSNVEIPVEVKSDKNLSENPKEYPSIWLAPPSNNLK